MKKNVKIDNLTLSYQEKGRENQVIILLHGWAQTNAFWDELIKRLHNKYHFYALDLPGFGLSQEPNSLWNTTDYARFLASFLKKLNIKNPIIIGHSFGGKIACVYAALFPVKKLIIYSASLSPTRSLIKRIHKHIVSLGKYLFPNQLYRLHSQIFKPALYQNKHLVSKKRSQRMLSIYTTNSQYEKSLCSKISADTLIIAGENDYIVSPQETKKLADCISTSRFITIPHATHFAHLENPKSFYPILEHFLNSN